MKKKIVNDEFLRSEFDINSNLLLTVNDLLSHK
jgi:hypothetical protein